MLTLYLSIVIQNRPSPGIIAGAAVGIALALLICLVLRVWFCRRRRQNRTHSWEPIYGGKVEQVPISPPPSERDSDLELEEVHTDSSIPFDVSELPQSASSPDLALNARVDMMARDIAELRMMVDASREAPPEYRSFA